MLPCELPEATASVATGIATGRLMIHHQNLNQPQSFGDFAHGHYTAVVHQVNLPFSYYRSKGTTSLPRYWRRGATVHDMRETLRSLATWKKHKLCLLSIHRRNRKDRQAYSLLLQTTMEPLPHGLLVLSSSKPLTGRTGHQLRDASAPGTTGDTAFTGLSPTITGQGLVSPTTCLVGTHPLRLHFLLLQEQRQADRKLVARNSQPTSQETDSFASRTPLTPRTSLTPTPVHPLTPTTSV